MIGVRYMCVENTHSALSTTFYFPVRLHTGYFNKTGTVQVYVDSSWTLVCLDGFGDIEAGVVCRHLGFSTGRVFDEANFGALMAYIGISNVSCSGAEESFTDCLYSTEPYAHCQSWNYTSVTCDDDVTGDSGT